MSIEAMKLALEALESCDKGDWSTGHVIHPSYNEKAVAKAITALRQAIEQAQKQEPVAGWTGNTNADAALVMLDRLDVSPDDDDRVDEISKIVRELASPPQRQPLTDEVLVKAAQSCLSPIQYDHFEALLENDPDAHNRLSRAIENERGK